MRTSGDSEMRRHWRTALGCMVAASIGTIGLYNYTSGVFVPALLADTGFTRQQLSLANFILSGTTAALSPFAGALMDRFGALRIIWVAVLGEAIAFSLFSVIPPVFAFYIGAMLLLALLGVGTTPPGFARIIATRFDNSRGLALGLAVSGLGMMAIFGPLVANRVIELSGWRGGYLALGCMALGLGGGGLLLIGSDKADGKADGRVRIASVVRRTGDSPGGWSALKRPLFWLLLTPFLLGGLFLAGYLFHLISILRERGFTAGRAAEFQSLLGVAMLAGRLGSGAAMDRFFAPYVAAVSFSISAIGCMLLLSDTPMLMAAGALGIGLTIGAELDLIAYLISRYFGVESFGRLYGLAYGAVIVCTGFSPLLVTLIEGRGGYSTALIVSAIGTAAGGALLAFLPRFPDHVTRVREGALAD